MASQWTAIDARAALTYAVGSAARSSAASARVSATGHVAVERIVGGGLIGDDVDLGTASKHLGKTSAAVASTPDGERLARPLGGWHALESVVERSAASSEVSGLEAAPDPLGIDLDAQRDPVVHGDGQGLGAPHATEAGRSG